MKDLQDVQHWIDHLVRLAVTSGSPHRALMEELEINASRVREVLATYDRLTKELPTTIRRGAVARNRLCDRKMMVHMDIDPADHQVEVILFIDD